MQRRPSPISTTPVPNPNQLTLTLTLALTLTLTLTRHGLGVGIWLGSACLAWHSLTPRLLSAPELEGKTIVVRADKGGGGKGGGGKDGGGRDGGGKSGGGKGGGGGRRGGGDEEEGEDGYTYSGRETGWVRPTGADFDDAPPADPKGSGALAR